MPEISEPPDDHHNNHDWLNHVQFRLATPRDIASCYEIEKASYPKDEAASRSALQYRQHHAAPYFWCAVLNDDDEALVVGFVCSTRCHVFDDKSMSSTHELDGPLLAIHSVVIQEEYRRFGLASAMLKHYVEAVRQRQDGIQKLVLISKSHLLGFYVNCGFSVMKPSEISHGKDLWFHAEMDIRRTKGLQCWVVDSFAEVGGTGNPAAVVLLSSSPEENEDIDNGISTTTATTWQQRGMEWMQRVGREFNLSETAFIWPLPDAERREKTSHEESSDDEKENDIHYSIRYITCNGTEVDLCGHATLASAAVLLKTIPPKKNMKLCFHARKHVLGAKRGLSSVVTKSPSRKEANQSPQQLCKSMGPIKITMDFPKKTLRDVVDASDRAAVFVMLRSAFSMSDTSENIIYLGIDQDGGDLFIRVTTESFLSLPPDNVNFKALMEWDGYTRGVIVCCKAKQDDDTADFYSRFFGPKAGINEDPVTGSAHCTLGPYFSTKLEKQKVIGKQMSQRGGIVECHVKEESVTLVGSAIVAMTGSLLI